MRGHLDQTPQATIARALPHRRDERDANNYPSFWRHFPTALSSSGRCVAVTLVCRGSYGRYNGLARSSQRRERDDVTLGLLPVHSKLGSLQVDGLVGWYVFRCHLHLGLEPYCPLVQPVVSSSAADYETPRGLLSRANGTP
jgi:hypothetical protein